MRDTTGRPKVLISYAHADAPIVRNIYARLESEGVQPWMDEKDILAGEDWLEAIRRAIRAADFYLLCLSPNSISRRGVLQREVRTALDVEQEKLRDDIYVIPAWIQGGEPFPKGTMNELPEALTRKQWVNLGSPAGWQNLTRAMNRQLSRSGRRESIGGAPAPPPSNQGSSETLQAAIGSMRSATKAGDRTRAERSWSAVKLLLLSTDAPVPDRLARPLLTQLAKRRWFDLLAEVTDLFMQTGSPASYVRRFYAEAMRVKGFRAGSLDMLQGLKGEATEPLEQGDVNLALYDAYVELYASSRVGTGRRAATAIANAAAACDGAWHADPRRNLLHAALGAALAARADANGVDLATTTSPVETARFVIDELDQRIELGGVLASADCAAALIAAAIIGERDRIQEWLDRFLEHPETDSHELDRVRQHFSIWWQGEQAAEIESIVQRVAAALLVRDGSSPAPGSGPEAPYERVFGPDSFVTLTSYRRGLEAAQSIARIEQEEGAGIASGVVVRLGDLLGTDDQELVLLTNAYVVTNDAAVKEQLAFGVPDMESLKVRFSAPVETLHRITSILFSSPPHELDVSIARLDPAVHNVGPLTLAKVIPARAAGIRVLGYPAGRGLAFSDGQLIDSDDRHLHYTTPTEGGSSGSAVFNREWRLIGIHHAGSAEMPRLHGASGTYAANEGISILAIMSAVRAAFARTP